MGVLRPQPGRRPGPPRPGLIFLAPYTLLNPSAAPEPAILIGPTPQCRALNLFDDATTELRIGLWDSTPYARHGRPHKLHELMHLLEGSVTLQDDQGTDVTVNPGDTVFVAKRRTVRLDEHGLRAQGVCGEVSVRFSRSAGYSIQTSPAHRPWRHQPSAAGN
jgi:uncharacterized cupin superfamily protein